MDLPPLPQAPSGTSNPQQKADLYQQLEEACGQNTNVTEKWMCLQGDMHAKARCAVPQHALLPWCMIWGQTYTMARDSWNFVTDSTPPLSTSCLNMTLSTKYDPVNMITSMAQLTGWYLHTVLYAKARSAVPQTRSLALVHDLRSDVYNDRDYRNFANDSTLCTIIEILFTQKSQRKWSGMIAWEVYLT